MKAKKSFILVSTIMLVWCIKVNTTVLAPISKGLICSDLMLMAKANTMEAYDPCCRGGYFKYSPDSPLDELIYRENWMNVQKEVVSSTTFDQGDSVIHIWYGPHQKVANRGIPQDLFNLLGNLITPDSIDSLSYSLNGVFQSYLSTHTSQNIRLALPGDFNAEIRLSALRQGLNKITLIARDHAGRQFSKIVTLDYQPGGACPMPFMIDWARITNIQDVAQVVDGFWTLSVEGVRSIRPHYDRLVAIGDVTWRDYEVTVPITVHSIHPVNPVNMPCVGILLRWDGHENSGMEQPGTIWYPIGAIGIFRWYNDSLGPRFQIYENKGGKSVANDTSGRKLNLGMTYIFKMSVQTIEGQSAGLYKFKVWQKGNSEPDTWDLIQQATSGLTMGSVLLLAHYVDATFGNVFVSPIP